MKKTDKKTVAELNEISKAHLIISDISIRENLTKIVEETVETFGA